jgi:hypothetical protein
MRLNKGLMFLFGFAFLSISVLGYFFNDYLNYKQESIVQKHLDMQLKELLEKLKERQSLVSTAAMLLANNQEVKECLKSNDKAKCEEYLKQIQDKFDTISFSQNIKIHIHTKDFRSFFRVWDLDHSKNDSLVSFRESLQKVKQEKKPIWGVEVGRYSLLIRGIAPIFEADEYLGSIEVISDFESMTEYFKQKDIDFFVLMDKKYEKIASMVEYPTRKRFNHFVIVNSVNSGLDSLRSLELQETSFVQTNGFYLVYTPIYDLSNNKVGFYLLKIPVSKLF